MPAQTTNNATTKTTPTNKSLLLFDLDGTLIDSVPDLADAVNATLQQLNQHTYDEATIRHWVGNGAKVLIARALANTATPDMGNMDAELAQAMPLFFANYRRQTCVRTQAFAGVTDGLTQLKQEGYTLAIITNKPKEFVPTIIEHFGWQSLFSLILGGDSLPVKKPDPTPLLHSCELLGFSPEQSYMIGDSKNDIVAGQQAGIDTLALTYGYNYGEDIRQLAPTHAFDDFSALTDFLLHERV